MSSWELTREIDGFSRKFYEFAMPAIDMFEDGNDLVVIIELPGFSKKDINLRIKENILHIRARRDPDEEQKYQGIIYYKHRPSQLDKRIVLPISAEEDAEKIAGIAKYADNGLVILRIPFPESTNIPIT